MTEKEYKLKLWANNSLYYSFPNGNLHHSISNVLTKVEEDLNALHKENQDLKHYHNEVLKCLHKTNEDYKKQINKLHEENQQLKGEVAHYKLTLISLEQYAKQISENWKVRKNE